MKTKGKKIFKGLVGLILIIALLLSFPSMAGAFAKNVGNASGWAADKIEDFKENTITVARVIVSVIVGGALIWGGVALVTAGAVIFGGALILAGAVMLALAVWPFFSKGEKPDGVNLGGSN